MSFRILVIMGGRVVQHRMTAEILHNTLFQCWKHLFLLTIILNIIIETSFSVEHLFKNKQSSRDFWLANDENKKQLWTFLVLYFINKNQYINDTYEKLIYSKDNGCLENHVVWTTCIISPCWNFVYLIIEYSV